MNRATRHLKKIARKAVQMYWLLHYRTSALVLQNRKPLDLVQAHYRRYSKSSHVTRSGFDILASQLDGSPLEIIETGTAAHGIASTLLFDHICQTYGGTVTSIDIRLEPSVVASRTTKKTDYIVKDSVVALQEVFAERVEFPHRLVIYLDSMDVDWNDPKPSSDHGFEEFMVFGNLVPSGTLCLIDDTPKTLENVPSEVLESARSALRRTGILPGKGSKILSQLSDDWIVLHHEYNLLLLKS